MRGNNTTRLCPRRNGRQVSVAPRRFYLAALLRFSIVEGKTPRRADAAFNSPTTGWLGKMIGGERGQVCFGCFRLRKDRLRAVFLFMRSAVSRSEQSVAARDVDDVLAASAPWNLDRFRRAARHIRPVGGRDIRRIAVGPIPRRLIGVGVMHVRRCGRGHLGHGCAIRSVKVTAKARQEDASMAMAERMCREGPHERTRGYDTAAARSPGRDLVRGKGKRNHADRRDQRSKFRVRHGTHLCLRAPRPNPQHARLRPHHSRPQTHT